MTEPVGFYCNHEDEPLGSRTHQAQSWTDDGLQVEANPHVYKAIGWEQTCPRAVPVYAVDVPALLAEADRLRVKLDLPCGSCHPCVNYADETWRAADRNPPHVREWDDLREEAKRLEAENDRLRAAVDLLGKQLQGGALDVKEALQFGTERLAIEDVESFLKRERDSYPEHTRQWSAMDELLDTFRLHMVTGTPLTEPKPVGHSEDPWV